MRAGQRLVTFTGTSPAAASTAIAAVILPGLWKADALTIDARLIGATGGTLDVYLQRKITTDVWADWVHFTQLSSGNAAINHCLTVTGQATALAIVAGGTDASPVVVLAANSYVNVLPGGDVRVVYVAGVGTSAGAAVTIYVKPFSLSY